MTALLEARGIDVAYGDVPVLRDLTVSLAAGEAVAIVGPNGAGKSTLMRALSGLLRPRRGEILFQGERTERWQPHVFARRGISHVPEGRGLLGELTVEENLRLGVYARGEAPDGFERVFALFPILKERLRQQAGMLSGGEQQMLAIARSLLSRPRALLVDELSLGLSPKISRGLLEVLGSLAAEGLGILFVEQNVQQAARVASRIYVLVQGEVMFAGKPADLAGADEIMRLYVGAD
jgi:branched-chain amino acid transport system ATP-binding protein